MNENVDRQQVEAPSPVTPTAPAAPRRRFAWLVWVAAWIAQRRRPASAGAWAVTAAVITLVVFAIPHSMFGSEIRYR